MLHKATSITIDFRKVSVHWLIKPLGLPGTPRLKTAYTDHDVLSWSLSSSLLTRIYTFILLDVSVSLTSNPNTYLEKVFNSKGCSICCWIFWGAFDKSLKYRLHCCPLMSKGQLKCKFKNMAQRPCKYW